NARSSGWGRDAAMHNVTADEGAVSRRQVVTRGDGGATTAATMERQFQQEEESESREERGESAKKTRYHHGLKVQGTLTVSHPVDSLTDGVSSLGVASPGGATASYSGGGKWEPVDAARRRRCEWWREAGFTGPTRYVVPQEPLRPVLALAEVGWNSDMRGAATIDTGAGAARGSTTTMYQKERRSMNSGAGIGGGSSGHRLSKKRKNFSLSAEAEASSPAATAVTTVAAATAEATTTAAAAGAPRSRPQYVVRVRPEDANGAAAAAAAAAAAGCRTMDVGRTERQGGYHYPCSRAKPSAPHSPTHLLPSISSSLASLMAVQRQGETGRGGGKEAPGFDAAVSASAAVVPGGGGGASEGKGGAFAAGSTAAKGIGSGVEVPDEDDNSSDGGAAQEDLSAWLHSTDDWWTS
ncbi:unnamed protein product, partial [Pylaiella littoralis]